MPQVFLSMSIEPKAKRAIVLRYDILPKMGGGGRLRQKLGRGQLLKIPHNFVHNKKHLVLRILC